MPSMRPVRRLGGPSPETKQDGKPLAPIFLMAAQGASSKKRAKEMEEEKGEKTDTDKCDKAETDNISESILPTPASRKCKKKAKKDVSYPCKFCEKVFPKLWARTSHMKIHNEKEIECLICSMKFINEMRLKMHMRSHLGIRKFKCDICGNLYGTSSHLVSHKRTHTKEKPFQCDLCPKAFTVSNALRVHKRTHTGERPYDCKICFKAFPESSKLRVHLRTHTGEKPFKCEICSMEFSQNGNLRTHMNTHSDREKAEKFTCKYCGKVFTHKQYFKTHIRYHEGDKRHECKICNKKFVTTYELAQHIDHHSGVKKYKCEICGKEMAQKQHLNKHMKQHEKGLGQCNKCFRFFVKHNEARHSCIPKKPSKGKRGKEKCVVATNSAMVVLIEEDAIKQELDNGLDCLLAESNPKLQINAEVKQEKLDQSEVLTASENGAPRLGGKERKTQETAAGEGDYQQLVIQQEITDQICSED